MTPTTVAGAPFSMSAKPLRIAALMSLRPRRDFRSMSKSSNDGGCSPDHTWSEANR